MKIKVYLCLIVFTFGWNTNAFDLPKDYKQVLEQVRAKSLQRASKEPGFLSWLIMGSPKNKLSLVPISGNRYITSTIVTPQQDGTFKISYIGNRISEDGSFSGGYNDSNPKTTIVTNEKGEEKVHVAPAGGGYSLRDEIIDRNGRVLRTLRADEEMYFTVHGSNNTGADGTAK